MDYIKKLFYSGLSIVVPTVFVIFIIEKGVEIIKAIISPILTIFGNFEIHGYNLHYVSAVFVLLAAIMIIGFIASKKKSFYVISKIEQFIPGYKAILRLYGKNTDSEDIKSIHGCLATVDDAWLFGFILEKLDDGMFIVFIPSAPIPTSGNVYIMTEQQVKHLDVPTRQIIKCLSQLGVGANSLLKGKVTW